MNSQFTNIVRILLGIILVVFGFNKLLPQAFIPLPELTEKAGDFMTSLGATGYVLKTVGIIEILIGVMLLFKKWVAFALIVLVPISLNILLFHLFLDVSGIAGALLVTTLNGILIYKHWPKYKSLFNILVCQHTSLIEQFYFFFWQYKVQNWWLCIFLG